MAVGRTVVADSSVILRIHLGEPGWERCAEVLDEAGQVLLGAVNHTEIEIRLRRAGLSSERDPYEVVPVDRLTAELAADARLRFPQLNLGDCFAYALARLEDLPLVATDRDFLATDIDVLIL